MVRVNCILGRFSETFIFFSSGKILPQKNNPPATFSSFFFPLHSSHTMTEQVITEPVFLPAESVSAETEASASMETPADPSLDIVCGLPGSKVLKGKSFFLQDSSIDEERERVTQLIGKHGGKIISRIYPTTIVLSSSEGLQSKKFIERVKNQKCPVKTLSWLIQQIQTSESIDEAGEEESISSSSAASNSFQRRILGKEMILSLICNMPLISAENCSAVEMRVASVERRVRNLEVQCGATEQSACSASSSVCIVFTFLFLIPI